MGSILLASQLTGNVADLGQSQIIDKVVAVVGRGAVTLSEVEQQIRLEAFFNRVAADLSLPNQRQALKRLIERRLLQQEMAVGHFAEVSEQEVARQLRGLRQEAFFETLDYAGALRFYELTAEEIADFLRQQINYERYWEFRFKAGVEVGRDEVAAYYENRFTPDFQRRGGSIPPPLDQVYDQVEEIVAAERADSLLDSWLKEVQATRRVIILDESLRPSKR